MPTGTQALSGVRTGSSRSTALLWGAGAIGQQVLASASAGATFPFTGADLPGLLALPALVTGLVSLGSRREAARHPLAQRHRARIGTAVARCADGYVVASALFIIGWITVLSAGYVHSGDDPGTFAAELVHPLADLLVLGAVLPLAMAAGRRGVAPVLALLAVTASDTLAVGAKISNGHPGAASQLLLIAGIPRPGLRALAGRLVARGARGCGPVHPGRGARRDRARRGNRGGGRAGADRLGAGGQPGARAGSRPGHRDGAARADRAGPDPRAPGQHPVQALA